MIYTTHYMEEAEALCSYVAIMDAGSVIAEGLAAGELISRVAGCSNLEALFINLTGKASERLTTPMMKLLSSVRKELTLLSRDFAGLLVLFVMPVVLVVVVTLVQENVLKSMGEARTKRCSLLTMDGQSVGRCIEEALLKTGPVRVVTELEGGKVDTETAKRAVAKGDFQLFLLIPEGMTEAFKRKAREGKESPFPSGRGKGKPAPETHGEAPSLFVYFDPTLRETFRSGVVGSLERITIGLEAGEKMKVLSGLLPKEIEAVTREGHGHHVVRRVRENDPRIFISIGITGRSWR